MRTPEHVPFHLPSIGDEEIDAVVECLKSGWLTTGPRAKEFESAFAEAAEVEHGIAVNSCTAGLHLALEACGIGPGDKAITSPYTFTATAHCVRHAGAEVVFADIDESLTLCPERFEEVLSENPDSKAVIPVHLGGRSADLESILAIARPRGLRVVEDAAHAFPCSHRGTPIGGEGDAAAFSFYATKTIVAGEGGMVTTNDGALAERMRTMRLHGIQRDAFERQLGGPMPSWYYEVVAPGFKYNMPDFVAAIGLAQLRKAEEFRLRRASIAGRYLEAFADLPIDYPATKRPTDVNAWHLFIILLRLDQIAVSRDRIIELLHQEGVETSVHFIPLHLHPYWRDRYQLSATDFPVALKMFRRALSLPLFPSMSEGQVEHVIQAVSTVLRSVT